MSAVTSAYKIIFFTAGSESIVVLFTAGLLAGWAGACCTCLFRDAQYEALQAALLDNLYILPTADA
jgi:hypothetical protein